MNNQAQLDTAAVFISYSHADKSLADRICCLLEADGFRCWIAPRDVLPGSSYAEQIIASLNHAAGVVLILSGRSSRSPHVRREAEYATRRDLPIFPLLIEKIEIPLAFEYFLGDFHRLDSTATPLESRLSMLLEAVRALFLPRPVRWPVPAPASVAPVSRAVHAINAGNFNPLMRTPFALRVISSANVVSTHLLSSSRIVVGRSADCDIRLEDPSHSRMVFGLNWSPEAETFDLVDFKTRTGVLLNGAPISQSEPLDIGDVLTLGLTRMIFELADQPSAP